MRTCSKCGCYIPDNWTTCPACHDSKQTIPDFANGVYRVRVFFDPRGIDDTIFYRKRNALDYARRAINIEFVKAVEVWDCQKQKSLEIF